MDFIKLEGIYALLAIIVICIAIIVGIIIILIIKQLKRWYDTFLLIESAYICLVNWCGTKNSHTSDKHGMAIIWYLQLWC